MQIYQVTASGVRTYFDDEEFLFAHGLSLAADGVGVMVGYRSRSEFAGPGQTYNPLVVIRLEEDPRLDTAATADSTRPYWGGFAGVEASTNVYRVLRRDSTAYLWDENTRRVVP
jgi:hypothetical protein